jgi:hypothetical protein
MPEAACRGDTPDFVSHDFWHDESRYASADPTVKLPFWLVGVEGWPIPAALTSWACRGLGRAAVGQGGQERGGDGVRHPGLPLVASGSSSRVR